MKAKINLDKDVLQRFLLDHAEKIVFGVVALGCLLMIYGAIARKGFDKSPKDLATSAENAQKNLDQTKPKDDLVYPDFNGIVRRTRDSMKEEFYAHNVPFSPFAAAEGKRGTPDYYPVAELQAMADRGPLSKRRRTEASGERWIMLWGVVPIQSQKDSFRKSFGGAKFKTKNDLPVYSSPVIQRAVVTSSSEEPKWEDINLVKAKEKAALLAASPPEMIDASLIPAELAVPLPPRADKRGWDDSIYPESLVGPAYRDVKEDPEQYKNRKVTWLAASGTVARKSVIFERKTDPTAVNVVREYFAVEFADEETADQRVNQAVVTAAVEGSTMATVKDKDNRPVKRSIPLLKSLEKREKQAVTTPSDTETDEPAATPAPAPPTTDAVATGPEYFLFRFVDYDVEPGKSYRYRVALSLANPNYGIESRYLVKPEDAKGKKMLTKFTEMSNAVTVPRDIRLLAKGASPTYIGEPWGEMMIIRWVDLNGLDAFKRCNVARGFTPNFPESDPAVDPKIDFKTNALVLDIRGGERLPGKFKADPKSKDNERPAEILILNAEGKLEVCDELKDAPEIEYRLDPKKAIGVQKATKDGPPPAKGGGLDGDEFK